MLVTFVFQEYEIYFSLCPHPRFIIFIYGDVFFDGTYGICIMYGVSAGFCNANCGSDLLPLHSSYRVLKGQVWMTYK